jgi:hypothetical protein
MLVVEGFLENGVFIPQKPLVEIKGRLNATLTIIEDDEKERQERITAWRQFGESVLNSDEVLEGEPERFRLRTIENI